MMIKSSLTLFSSKLFARTLTVSTSPYRFCILSKLLTQTDQSIGTLVKREMEVGFKSIAVTC